MTFKGSFQLKPFYDTQVPNHAKHRHSEAESHLRDKGPSYTTPLSHQSGAKLFGIWTIFDCSVE